MKRLTRAIAALLIGVSLSATIVATASAQDVPTGAARLIEKVQTRIFISQASLTFHVAAILENQPSPGGK
jgi:hypothetical protein